MNYGVLDILLLVDFLESFVGILHYINTSIDYQFLTATIQHRIYLENGGNRSGVKFSQITRYMSLGGQRDHRNIFIAAVWSGPYTLGAKSLFCKLLG